MDSESKSQSKMPRKLRTGLFCLFASVVTVLATDAFPQSDPASLLPGKAVEREIKGQESHTYQIGLSAGQFLHVVVQQKEVDAELSLQAPDGRQILAVDDPGGRWGPVPLVYLAEESGVYRLNVRSFDKADSTGRYEIKIVNLREATAIDREHIAAEKAFGEARKLSESGKAESRQAVIEKYNQALSFYVSAGDNYRQALTHHEIGIAHVGGSDFRQALESFSRALPLFQLTDDRSMQAETLNYLGGVNDVLGDVRNALSYYEQALTLFRSLGDGAREALLLNNLAKTYSNISEWQQAIQYYNRALAAFRAAGDRELEALALHNLGVAHNSLGDPEKALEYHQQSLALRRALKNQRTEADSLTSMGAAYSRLGRLTEAVKFYNDALLLRLNAKDRRGEGTTLNYLGVAYAALNQPEKALECLQQALQIQRATGNRRVEAIVLGNLGEVFINLSQPEKALEMQRQAIEIFRSIGDRNYEARTLVGIARAERNAGRHDEARKQVETAISVIEDVRASGDMQQLRASYLASRQDAYQLHIDLLMQLHKGDPSAGYDALALQTAERARARSLLELLTESSVDVRQGADTAILKRERELIQQINGKAFRLTQRNTAQQNDLLKKEISRLEDELRQVQAEIRNDNPHYAAITQPEPLSLKEIQGRLLDQDSLLLEYSLGDERSYLWAVTADSIAGYELPKRELIQKAAQRVTGLLTARGVRQRNETAQQRVQRIAAADAELPEAARQLSEMILAPAAGKLANRRLLVVPDGALQYLPFAMLPVSTGKGETVPLIVQNEIVTLPSASTLAVLRKELTGRQPAPKMLAVFADPVFAADDERNKARAIRSGGKGETKPQTAETLAEGRNIVHEEEKPAGILGGRLLIPRLPFTRQEADRILAIAPNSANLKAVDFKASRAMAISTELGLYRYLHFATHGLLDTERANLSALVLSLVDEQGKPQDGFLRANEIYNLNLPAELVVLSACQTGLGREIKGEGLVGLTRGFMYAGAARVVVSLWNVNDRATAELMPRFYQKMLKEGERPAAALRSAQVEMWRQKQWSAPYYWAAFVLQGEWR